MREGLKILIGSDPLLKIAGEAACGESAVRLAKELRPDVVVLDVAMPRGNGLEAARDICRTAPESKVLVLSAYQDPDLVQQLIDAGVSGYLTKHSAAEELLNAIRQVAAGHPYYSPQIARKMQLRRQQAPLALHGPAKPPRLTRRELEVLTLIATGEPNKAIAYSLGLSIKTVEKHRQAAMDKLNLHDTASLTRYALSKGLVSQGAGQAAART